MLRVIILIRALCVCFPDERTFKYEKQVVRGDRKEKRRGGEDRQVVREEQRSAVAHCERVPAVVSHRLPGAPGRAVHEQHQSHHHRVRGERHRQQLVHARQTVPAGIRLSPARQLAPGVQHEQRGDRVHVPGHRAGRQRRRFRRGARRLPSRVRRAGNDAGVGGAFVRGSYPGRRALKTKNK